MKASELRIGNYYNQFGNIHQVNHVIIKDLTKAPEEQLWCKPIPLTEEWLLKFGFKSIGKLHPTFQKVYLIEEGTLGDKYVLRVKINKHESIFICDIKYVHQLQNLYFALTSEELTIKES